jgi:hypothetical protein
MRILMGLAGLLLTATVLLADPPKKPTAQLPTGNLDTKDWLKYSTQPLAQGEIDRLVNAELAKVGVKPAAITTDEQFLRRVHLDLTGRLPMPADITEFLADKSPDKRAKLIDKLLETRDFGKHWAQYWKTVITSRTTDLRSIALSNSFEGWLKNQLMADKSWDFVAREMLTAKGQILFAEPETNGQLFFLTSRKGMDAVTEIAAETSRVFLGIQLQCAQCHDHPSDVWKRQQFHEFAAYFAKYREQPVRDGMMQLGFELVAKPGFMEYQMPDKNDPKKTTRTLPRFLDGKGPQPLGFKGLPDEARRQSLADAITSTNNPWFAGAYVNRMWGELMGQAFYTPIDDLGPQKDAMMPAVLARVAAAWRGNGYPVKQLFRDIMTSDAYQRQIRPGESADEHLLFATHNPVRMNADSLWQSLNDTLGQVGQPRFGKGPPKGPFGGFQGLEAQFKQEFAYDPSTKAEEIEGSISQALMLMNNAQINQKIKATGTNLLARILSSYSEDDEAVRMLYLRTLARRPTDREASRCRQHIESVGNRAEAFEDLLWALINSTEYQTKR